MKSMKLGTTAFALTLCVGSLAYAAAPSPEPIANEQTQMKELYKGK